MLHVREGMGHGPGMLDNHGLHSLDGLGCWCYSRGLLGYVARFLARGPEPAPEDGFFREPLGGMSLLLARWPLISLPLRHRIAAGSQERGER